MRLKAHGTVLVIGVASASVVITAATQLHSWLRIRPGLWEFTSTPKIDGEIIVPDAILARIPSAERATFLADTRRNLSRPSRERECVTQAKFEQRVFSLGHGCNQRIVANTPRTLEVLTECRAEDGASSQSTRRTLASSPLAVSTFVHAVTTKGGRTMTMNSTEKAVWLRSDCGNAAGIHEVP